MENVYADKLAEALKKFDLDAVLIAPSDDMQFLLGVKPFLCPRFQGFVFKRDRTGFYICNVLSRDEMREALGNDIPIYSWWDHEGFLDVTRAAFTKHGLLGGRIGVNGAVRAFNVQSIAEHMDVTFTDGRQALEQIRLIKTPQQMQDLRDAAAVADRAFERLLGELRPGMTEGDIAESLKNHMAEQGGVVCMAMVCAGDNGAYPHYMGNQRVIRHGDPVLMDFGCQYRTMRSDTSRTVFVGEVNDHQHEIYQTVLRAQLAAEAAAVAGAYIPDIDKTARDVITEAGYGEYFLTRTGHGIGAAMHEGPFITQTNHSYLEAGMAFSIEPGIYIAGDIGVRIEDILLIGPEGTEVLNKTSKELIVVR